jgi:hypothetical protein
MSDTLLVETRFRGPVNAGNGGYVAGRLAAVLGDGPAEVSLRAPTPLETPLAIARTGTGARLLHGDKVIAEAQARPLVLDVPPPPDAVLAEQSTRHGGADADQPYAHCFVCGRARAHGEGLNVFPGWLPDGSMVATLWRPDPAFADADGDLRPAFAWAALDCPGGFAAGQGRNGGGYVTARMHVALHAPVRAGEPHVVIGWPVQRDGRKVLSGTAIYDRDRRVLARALSLWVEMRPGF